MCGKKKLKCKGLFDFEVKLVRETKGKGEREVEIDLFTAVASIGLFTNFTFFMTSRAQS